MANSQLHPAENTQQSRHQKKILMGLTALFIILGLIYLIYWAIFLRHYEETDNAYVAGNVVAVTSQVGGNIIAIKVDDTDFVKAGTPLVMLDPTDSLVLLEQAKANLALILRQTQQLYIQDRGLKANIEARESNLKQASADLKRREQAIHLGGISQEELNHARDTYNIADSALINAQTGWQANHALIEKTSLTQHPNVMQAIEQVKQAYLNFVRNTIYAPVTGYISKRAAQVGQRIAPGSFLMAIVPLEDVWVDANFKEKQLRKMRLGQSVELTADVYGSGVIFHGTVSGFAGGTGSAFALLPAQNATGNWIKVVQRLPVRISLNSQELKQHPLRIGLSMEVTVDTSSEGQNLNHAIKKTSNTTAIFNNLDKQADTLIAKIIHDNLIEVNDNNLQKEDKLPGSKE
ncbi:MAG: efflux RND transporter periplasmic adaptor subunit [bacterium]|nr:efflux RND transporter periplasmic adaptor subunit [bacterium]